MPEAPENVVRVLVADDHTIVRAGIRSLLERIPGVRVVAEAADGREALEMAKAQLPEVVVMDIGMPGLNGIEATVRLGQELPAVRVIILSMHANEEYVARAFKAGARAYVLKTSAVGQLETALHAVLKGETYLCPQMAQRCGRAPASQLAEPGTILDKLTPRQREILQLIAESKNTKEIAFLLELSPKTVEFHRAELMNRLDIHDIPGLVRYAIQHGLTHPDP